MKLTYRLMMIAVSYGLIGIFVKNEFSRINYLLSGIAFITAYLIQAIEDKK